MQKSAYHLTNNLIGALLISVLMFVLVYLIDRGNPQPGGRAMLIFLALTGTVSLLGWMGLAWLRLAQTVRSRADRG